MILIIQIYCKALVTEKQKSGCVKKFKVITIARNARVQPYTYIGVKGHYKYRIITGRK